MTLSALRSRTVCFCCCRCFCFSPRTEASSSLGRFERRLISPGNVRGSEPHNHDPSGATSDCYRESGRSLSHRPSEDSPSCLLRLLLALCSSWMARFIKELFLFFPYLESFCFCSCQAAVRWLTVVSALVPIAQMNPSSSRATAVTILPCGFPAALSFIYRLCKRCCAFHAISLAASEILSCRLRKPYQMHGGRR